MLFIPEQSGEGLVVRPMKSFAFMQGFFDFIVFQNQTFQFAINTNKKTNNKTKLTTTFIKVDAKSPKKEPKAAFKARFPSLV